MKTQSVVKIENKELQKKSEVVTDVTHVSQRSYKLNAVPMIKHLNLQIFKLHPCPNTQPHNHKHCVYYHNSKDRKRYGQNYSQNMCEYITNGQKCPYGDSCPNAHSRVEQLYKYETYKKKFCSHYPKRVEECEYGDYCSFAHSQEDIQTELIHNYQYDQDFYMFHYKTVFCPFNLTEHDKAKCVYAHNLQDYRRRPTYYMYEPISCFNWKLKQYITDYNEGCQNGLNCSMCHGWKQLHYHPSLYRTQKCQETGCKKGQCPNYHSQNQKRVVENDVNSKHFRFVSKNRIIDGVFKTDPKKVGFKPNPSFKPEKGENKKHAYSMFDKTRSPEQKKTRTLILESKGCSSAKKVKDDSPLQKESKGWINSPIDSEDDDIDVSDLNHPIEKLLEGE